MSPQDFIEFNVNDAAFGGLEVEFLHGDKNATQPNKISPTPANSGEGEQTSNLTSQPYA